MGVIGRLPGDCNRTCRRGRYALGRDVLMGAPAARVDEAMPAVPAPLVQEATTLETSTSPIAPDDKLVLQIGDRRILVPVSIKGFRLPDRAVRAAVEVDPESHEVRIVLE